MYKQVKKHKKFLDYHDVEREPVVTLADRHGGVCHIAVDDGCYIAYLLTEDLGFVPTHYIFAELHTALSELPSLEESDTIEEQ